MFAGTQPILPIYPQTEESQEPFQSLLTWQSMAVKKPTENGAEVASFDPQEEKNMAILRERTS